MAAKGSPIASATSISDLAGATIAAPIGTTSYDYIVANIPDANRRVVQRRSPTPSPH